MRSGGPESEPRPQQPRPSPASARGPAETGGPEPRVILKTADLARATLIIIGIVALALLMWQLSDVLVLAFAAILFATGLRSLGEFVRRVVPIGMTVALAAVTLLVVAIIGGFVYFLGQQIAVQAQAISGELPTIIDSLGRQLGISALNTQLGDRLVAWLSEPGFIGNVLGITAGVLGIAANLLLAVIAGLYLAFRPETYLTGFLRLFPRRAGERVAVALHASGHALKLWLLGQMISMLLVGVLTTIGLMLIGIESPLALGLLAGLLEFVPYVGPWLSAVPALLIALADPGPTIFWVGGLYILVQQFEGSIITPLVQQRAVDLPPVLTIFSLAAMGTVLGPVGVLLATPLALVALVFVTQFYIRDTLHETAALPGEHAPRHGSPT